MPSTYKTPGVYIEEISIFPPSVAEVETAVPAFLGYTEKAWEINPDDLDQKPTRIKSMVDFVELFGGPPPVEISNVVLDENSAVTSTEQLVTYYLYDSLRLFFDNGGGNCYIISIGKYGETPDKTPFETGIAALKKEDEPTIIIAPDAVSLGDDLYGVQQKMLKQCGELGDRVAVYDLHRKKDSDPAFDWSDGVDEFRNNIGIKDLKYGMAYIPWLKTRLDKKVRYRDIQGKVTRGGSAVGMEILTDDAEVKNIVSKLNDAVSDQTQVNGDINSAAGSSSSLKAHFTGLMDDFKSTPQTNEFKALFNFIYELAELMDSWTTSPIKNTDLQNDAKDLIDNSLKGTYSRLIAYDRGADSELTGAFNLYQSVTVSASEWGTIFGAGAPAANPGIFTGSNNTEKMQNAAKHLSLIFDTVNAAFASFSKSASEYETSLEQSLLEAHPTYKNIVKSIKDSMTLMPPSGAIAGIYAYVDNNRGVWKAPANVSLSSVIGPSDIIDDEDQQSLNVHVDSGKSVNAIRGFTGRGTIVWGARTLAGNDNEWRYIPVRRFFNMVEESVKKSTYWAVFEPNDANTWVKVKAMIENYLTQKWRDGALAGAKPDEAFFVKVGLGLTMTNQDILEGRMNVEIGMAVVRPAEFIILKFSHKMQES